MPRSLAWLRVRLRTSRWQAAEATGARVNDILLFRITQFSRAPTEAELKQIKWDVVIGDREQRQAKVGATELSLRLAKDADGKTVRAYAYVQGRSEQVAAAVGVGEPKRLIWLKTIPAAEREAFREKVIDVAQRLAIDPNDLMACMAFETGGSFRPDQRNAAGSSAVGLIQFMDFTAERLNTTSGALSRMSRVQQMEYVYEYFAEWKGKLHTVDDLYMAILWPKAVGKPGDYVLFEDGDRNYRPNRGLDRRPRDGKVTKAEAAAAVHRAYEQGRPLTD